MIGLLGLKRGPKIGELLEAQFKWILGKELSDKDAVPSYYHIHSVYSDAHKEECLQYLRSLV